MTERKMSGHTDGGGGLQKHSLGDNYPGVSVILEVGGIRWYGVMESSSGSTLYVQSREEQESLFSAWRRQWSFGKRMSDHGITGHRYRVDGRKPRNYTWFDGLPPLPPKYTVVERTVYDVYCDGVPRHLGYSDRKYADLIAEQFNGPR